MNYFAHSYHHLDRPYFVAGTAIPDWLVVCDRRHLRRERIATAWAERRLPGGDDEDEEVEGVAEDDEEAQVIGGILRHLEDDARFHASATFSAASTELTLSIRARYPERRYLRAGFLGHVLTELLLDACLIEADPRRLDTYYEALAGVDPGRVQGIVNRLLPAPTSRLAPLIERFLEYRFLGDYVDDGRLLFRLEQVLRRVGLPALPTGFQRLLPACRDRVRRSAGELLAYPVR